MRKLVFIELLMFIIICIYSVIFATKSFEKRATPFIKGSAYGLLVAVAVPIETVSRNVFFSFNFESNFALPDNNTFYDAVQKEDVNDNFQNVSLTTLMKKRSLRSVLTRKFFYNILQGHLMNFGLNKADCFLRIICEEYQEITAQNNGLIGSLLRILLLPSASIFEDIGFKYHEAEINGCQSCEYYYKDCPINIFDILSKNSKEL